MECVAMMVVLEHHPNLIQLSHTLMAVLDTVYEVVCGTVLEGHCSGGVTGGGGAGLRVG